MTNLLSIITFLPIVAAAIMAMFLRGDDAAAQKNAKWLALIATTATFLISLFVLAKQARYRGSALTSLTISVWPEAAAAPHTPVPIGIRVCSVASGPVQGPSTRSVPSTQ